MTKNKMRNSLFLDSIIVKKGKEKFQLKPKRTLKTKSQIILLITIKKFIIQTIIQLKVQFTNLIKMKVKLKIILNPMWISLKETLMDLV